jgi:hypothetical protein
MLAFTLTAGLPGCYSIESRHSYDSTTDFSSLNSYAWVPIDSGTFTTAESSGHYQRAMENRLSTKGYNLNAKAPDFLIKTHHVESYREYYKNVAGNVEFPKAMIRINFLDPSSKMVIYESAAYAYLAEDSSQKTKNTIIDRAVEALLGEFPPGR